MLLTLSGDNMFDTIIFTDPSGSVAYDASIPFKPGTRKTLVRKANDAFANFPEFDDGLAFPREEGFTQIAALIWHAFGGSRIIYEKKEWDVKYFLPEDPTLPGTRLIKGPSGVCLRWNGPILETTDGRSALIAMYTPSDKQASQNATLWVAAEGYHMIDLIVVTFLHLERTRRSAPGHDIGP